MVLLRPLFMKTMAILALLTAEMTGIIVASSLCIEVVDSKSEFKISLGLWICTLVKLIAIGTLGMIQLESKEFNTWLQAIN